MLTPMKISLQQSIGLNVRAARAGKGLTQGQLAERVGCSWETISRIERGKNPPTVAILYSIAKILGVSFDMLIEGEGGCASLSRLRKESDAVFSLRSLDDESLDVAIRVISAIKSGKTEK